MEELLIGAFAESRAGHDIDKIYVIMKEDTEYVYLVDGKIRTLSSPKKKKKKHIRLLEATDRTMAEKAALADQIKNNRIKNEEIKRAIKMII